MNQSYLQHQIKSMQIANTQKVMEAIMVTFAALFTMAVLPSLLVQYVYADQNLVEAPPVLEYIPVACFAVSILYTVYVIFMNMKRGAKIKQLEQELAFVAGADDSMNASMTDDAELKELEKMVDEAMATKAPAKSKKPAAKKRK